jgi:hypothetical protein
MDISILGYKINCEIFILMAILLLIIFGHSIFCSCNNFYSLIEGNATMTTDTKKKPDDQLLQTQYPAGTSSTMSSDATTPTPENGTTKKEGFTGANINYGESSLYNLDNDQPVNTSSWSAQNMTVIPGQPLSDGVKKFLARTPQPVPLPEGELLMFANTPFKPECCPNTFSNSSGCACMTGEQYNYLIVRGGNNVPYSEY